MAAVDPDRRRAALTAPELAAAALLARDPLSPALASESARAAVTELSASGVLVEGELTPWLRELLAPITDPERRALAEIHHGEGMIATAQAWLSHGRGLIGRNAADGSIELSAIEPAMLPAALAIEVGLAARPAPPDREPLIVTEAELEAPGDGPLAALLASREGSWRITALEGEEQISLAVLDGGEQGLWLIELASENGELLALTPSTNEVVAARITGLFAAAGGGE
jgi:hypothetical protein